MILLASARNSVDPVNAGAGLLMRLRAWFARGAPALSAAAYESRDVIIDDDTRCDVVSSAVTQQECLKTAVLLPFPIRGEALLVKLADHLRKKVASNTASHGSFYLTLSRRPRPRLTIDRAAYVEFRADLATYHLVVDVVQDTRIAVETTDFDTVVKFVAQYVTDRLSDAVLTEAAS